MYSINEGGSESLHLGTIVRIPRSIHDPEFFENEEHILMSSSEAIFSFCFLFVSPFSTFSLKHLLSSTKYLFSSPPCQLLFLFPVNKKKGLIIILFFF